MKYLENLSGMYENLQEFDLHRVEASINELDKRDIMMCMGISILREDDMRMGA